MNKVPRGRRSPGRSGTHIQMIKTQHGNWLTTKRDGSKRKINGLLKWGRCYNKGATISREGEVSLMGGEEKGEKHIQTHTKAGHMMDSTENTLEPAHLGPLMSC